MKPPKKPTVRLFLALWPDDAVRRQLHSIQQGWAWPPDAAPVGADQLHLTLHFLGNVPLERLGEFARALAVEAGPVTLELRTARPRVWPGGIAVLELASTPALLRLHASLAGALAGLGWPQEERRYRPHVTLARRAAGARPPAGEPAPAEWHAGTGYALVRSIPGHGYEVVRLYGRRDP